jgi:type IV secretory pathway VirB4 component
MVRSSQSTQNFIPIKDIRDGVVILKNESLRMILMVSSVNFALKSEDEQTALLLQFQNFLNALDFSVQILIQSRRLDIAPYLAILSAQLDHIESELIKIQAQEYIQFISNLTSTVSIMSKNFFVVIPYTTVATVQGGAGAITSLFKKPDREEQKGGDARFEEYKIQLEQRSLIVEQGLSTIGLRAARLGSEELIELFYKSFNPQDKQKPAVPEELTK